jgi:hypothetical protein
VILMRGLVLLAKLFTVGAVTLIVGTESSIA